MSASTLASCRIGLNLLLNTIFEVVEKAKTSAIKWDVVVER